MSILKAYILCAQGVNTDLDFGLQNCEEIHTCCQGHQVCGIFVIITWAKRARNRQKGKKKGAAHLKHLFPLPQGFFYFGKLELQDAVGMLLPLELLWVTSTVLRLRFSGVFLSQVHVLMSHVSHTTNNPLLRHHHFQGAHDTNSFLCPP